ncbi:MAG: anhydro-N-acetylmuramic acid kinase [Gemmatimonadaceae bacterium]
MTPENRPMVLVGLMSGTSLDGISAAVVRFSERPGTRIGFELLAFTATGYSPEQRARLGAALHGTDPAEYCRLNFELGEWLAAAAVSAIAEAGIARSDIAGIASHGQTVWHEAGHSTWQFGESAVIAERTGLDVISDFRVRDVAAGGQGAPLVPVADALLFSSDGSWRALQNLGGIGNVTVVPPGGELTGVRAFDTGPGCAVIDGVVRKLFPDMPFDRDGAIAAKGNPVEPIVDALLRDPYFTAPPPKSTGRELFSISYIDKLVADCRAAGASDEDAVATAVSLTARSVADSYLRFMPEPVDEVLVSGGGGRNPALMAAIRAAVAPMRVTDFGKEYFDGEAKEAVAFALLGYLYLMRIPANVPTSTGARGRRVLGKLTPA